MNKMNHFNTNTEVNFLLKKAEAIGFTLNVSNASEAIISAEEINSFISYNFHLNGVNFSKEEVAQLELLIDYLIEKGGDFNNIQSNTLFSVIPNISPDKLELLLNEIAFENLYEKYFFYKKNNNDYNNLALKKALEVINCFFEENILNKLPDFSFSNHSKALIDEDGFSLLHKFILHNKIELAENLLSILPFIIEAFDDNKVTALELAYSIDNAEGMKLLLGYDSRNIVTDNHCSEMLDRFENDYYLPKKLPSVKVFHMDNLQTANKLFVVISGSGGHNMLDYDIFLKNIWRFSVPTLLIGDGIEMISLDGIKTAIEKYSLFSGNIEIAILAHGHPSKADTSSNDINHKIILSSGKIATADLFQELGKVFVNKPLNISLISCHGGAALFQDINVLPEGSRVVVFSKAENPIINQDIENIPYPINAENPGESFMLSYLLNMEAMNNVAGIAYSGGGLKFTDQEQSFFGAEFTECQKDKLIEGLKELLCLEKECDERIKKEFKKLVDLISNKISKADNIEDLMAPESIYADWTKTAIIPKEGDVDGLCNRNVVFEASNQTDYSLCNSYYEIGIPACVSEKIEEPIFGATQALLYLLGKGEFNCQEQCDLGV